MLLVVIHFIDSEQEFIIVSDGWAKYSAGVKLRHGNKTGQGVLIHRCLCGCCCTPCNHFWEPGKFYHGISEVFLTPFLQWGGTTTSDLCWLKTFSNFALQIYVWLIQTHWLFPAFFLSSFPFHWNNVCFSQALRPISSLTLNRFSWSFS